MRVLEKNYTAINHGCNSRCVSPIFNVGHTLFFFLGSAHSVPQPFVDSCSDCLKAGIDPDKLNRDRYLHQTSESCEKVGVGGCRRRIATRKVGFV